MVDLSKYIRIGRYNLPEPTRTTAPANNLLAQEVSGVTYNWDTDTLFVVGDGGTSVTQISKTGEFINTMTLAQGGSSQGTEFFDPEGITYIGGGRFVMTEERDQRAVSFTYAPGTTLTRAAAQTVVLGPEVGNVGLEGLSFDPLTGGFIFVKEKTPISVFQTGIDFAAGTATNGGPAGNSTPLFNSASLGDLIDLADVFALSNLPALNGTAEGSRLLLLSQESGRILEVDRMGNIISFLNIVSDPGNPLDVVAQQHEGITMDRAGNIYVVSENGGGNFDTPQLWVYALATGTNAAPTAITLGSPVTAIDENTSTTARVKVADVVIADDGLGTNTFSLSGADAAFFEIDSTGLFLKAGTVLDFEAKTSYAVTARVDDTSVGATPDASADFTLTVRDIAAENVAPAIYISEIAPFSSGNSAVGADWFEVTNGGSSAIDITGWRVDDSSNSFASSLALNGVTSIAAGESVIFLETSNLAATSATFITTWFGGTAPAGLRFGSYSGGGIGLSTGGDAVNLFDAGGTVRANAAFGTSATGPFATFNNAGGLNGGTVTTLSQVGVNGAFVAANSPQEIGSPGTVGRLIVSEVAPWSSGDSPVGADWFELTNTSAFAIDITGWKVDDSSQSPAAALLLNGITSIAPGESVIFLESANLAATSALFIDTWFGGTAPAGLKFGSYTGGGIGLSTGGDGVNIYDAANALRASVSFGASPTGPFATFDNAAGANGTALTTLSTIGTNGAFVAVNDGDAIGSPGRIAAPPPSVVSFTPATGATGVFSNVDILATFGGAVTRGTGTITLRSADGTVIESFDAATSDRITLAGNSLVIDPTAFLLPGVRYTLGLPAGAVSVAGQPAAALAADSYAFTVAADPAANAAGAFILSAPAGWGGAVAGSGSVFGTPDGLQDVTIVDRPGRIVLDGSFSSGGDRVRFDGAAAEYTVRRNGSSIEVSDGDTIAVLPVGVAGTDLIFADGSRLIRVAGDAFTLGSQTVTTTAAAITAAGGAPTSMAPVDPDASAIEALGAGVSVVASGPVTVFGTAAAETVAIAAGSRVILDGTFNLGGDTILFDGSEADYAVVRAGSAVILTRGGEQVTVPVGLTGTTLAFADGTDTLRFDTASNSVRLGDRTIAAAPASAFVGEGDAAQFAALVAVAPVEDLSGLLAV